MKTIEAFLAYLYSLDVKLWLEPNNGASSTKHCLRCNAPETVLTETLSAQIAERKADIIAFLNQTHSASNLSYPTLRPVSRQGNLPLSFAQQRLWFLDQLEPGNPLYNISGAVRLQGSLDAIALEKSFNEIVRRHEVLRTGFKTVEGQPVQSVIPRLILPLKIVDLQGLGQDEQETEVLHLAKQDTQHPFDLAQGPLLRVTLVKLEAREQIVLVTMHHIVSDAWSTGIFIRELTALYPTFLTAQPVSLPELPIQYIDFAVWQRQWLQGDAIPLRGGKANTAQLAYWRKQLAGAPAMLDLPTDYPRPAVQTFQGATQSFTLSPDLSLELKQLSQQAGNTLFMTLLAAFNLLLGRYTGSEDIVVGTPIANRNQVEIEELIGFFVNTLVLRVDLSHNPTVRELLGRVQQVALEAYAHQDLPFESLVEALQPQRSLSHTPLFQVMFVLQNAPISTVELPGLTVSPLEISSDKALFDLTLSMLETAQGLTGRFEYNTDLFAVATIERMVGHYRTILAGMVAHPERPLSDLPLLTTTERHQLLTEWNDTQVAYPGSQCIHQLFEVQVQKTPDAVALVFDDQSLTYRELNQQANQVAHYLQTLGVKPEVIVGLCVARSHAMIVGLLGILKAGGAYLPLDPAYPPERLTFMLADSQVPLILTLENRVTGLPEHTAKVVCLDTDWAAIAQKSKQNPESQVTVENLAYLIYTSGSTGTPKGVLVSHEGLGNLTQDKIRTCRVQPDSRILQFFSLSFDASIPEWVMAFGAGAALYLATPEDLLPGPPLMQLLRDRAITHITLPPSALAALPEADLPALQMVLVGGEAPSPELIAQWSKGRLFINAYGPTETSVNASMVECGNSGQSLPTIRPAANKQLYILDRDLQPLPIGVPGELYIGGVGLARGYLKRPQKTAETFIPNPFSNQPGSRLYKTGDLACYLEDGNIKLLGRLDRQVKLRGFRIELGEIEALLAQHADVRESAVIVREDQPGDKRLVAYVVAVLGRMPTKSALYRFVRETLPSYMVPGVFVMLDALPLNANGKLDRHALPAPEIVRPELDTAFAAPRNQTEDILAQVFAQVLEIDRVGIDDDFFELGGHSLLATKLIARLSKVFQMDFSVVDLFKDATVAGLAKQIESAQRLGTRSQLQTEQLTVEAKQAYFSLLQADAVLDSSIQADSLAQTATQNNAILLTGATGFIGSFLLYEILQQTEAKVYCLIRARSTGSAQEKLQNCLSNYHLWQNDFSNRIVPIVGDLSQPLLGLSRQEFEWLAAEVDTIYHNGAWVHHASPYVLLKATNVLGTQDILRLACQKKVKPVHFISATSVFASTDNVEKTVFKEQDSIKNQAPLDGYSQSKWVAEMLITAARDRGIPTYIYRLGRVSGHSQTGVFNQDDFLYRLIIGCVQLGSIPNEAMMLDIIPVDYASKAIIYLSNQETSSENVFHLVHPNPVSSDLLFETLRSLGYPIQSISYNCWHKKLLKIAEDSPGHALYPLVSLFPARKTQIKTSNSSVLKFDCQNTLNGLSGTEIACPPINFQLLQTYFSCLIQTGFLAAPSNHKKLEKVI